MFRRKQREIQNLCSTNGKRSYKNDKNGDPKNDKNGEEITKNISYILHFLIAQDLWQVLHQILSITFLKEFINLNVHTDTMMQSM